MKVLVIIPAYNEEHNIKKLVMEIEAIPDIEYIIVNDCSTDLTKKICKDNDYHLLDLSVNLGIGGCVQTGYKYALENGYDIAVQIDGDGQHDPSFIKKVIEPIEQGKCDICIGSRFIEKEGFQSTTVRRIGIIFLSWLIKICCGVRVYDVTSGYRAVNKEYIKYYASNYAQDYPEPEAILWGGLHGAKIQEVPVVMKEREHGTSSIHMFRSWYYMIKVTVAIIIYRILTRRGQ